LKCYLELVLPVKGAVASTRRRAKEQLDELRRGLETAIAPS